MKKLAMITLPLVGGLLIGKYATANARADYRSYKKPPFSPPGYAFPIVWPALYTSMGISHLLVNQVSTPKEKLSNNTLYVSQLSLNYLWSLLYFKYKLRGTALIESFILLSTAILTTRSFYKTYPPAGVILIPYVLWLSYASYLTSGSYALNHNTKNYKKNRGAI